MSYLLGNSGKGVGRGNGRNGGLSPNAKSALAVLIFLCLIIIISAFRPSIFGGALQKIGMPFWSAEDWAGNKLGNLSAYFSSKANLQNLNNALEAQLANQNLQLQNEAAIEEENESLKNTLGRTNQKNLLLANVLQGPAFSPYDTFILDVGSNSNIQTGDMITVDGILPIGSIVQVYKDTSIASLYSSPGNQIEVAVGNISALFTAIGSGDGNFEVTVPQSLAQSLASATSTQIFLPGFLDESMGSVNNETANVAQATQTLYFRSGFNIEQVRQVYVDLGSVAVPAIAQSTSTRQSGQTQ